MAEPKSTRKKTTGRKTTRRTTKKSDGQVMLKSFNPRTGEVMREIPAHSPAEVADVVANARKVAPEWAAIPVEGRVRLLKEVRHQIYRMQDRLVETVAAETGKSLFEALTLDVVGAASLLYGYERFAARALRPQSISMFTPPRLTKALLGWKSRIEWRPYGVVGCITPWNYPLTNTFLGCLGPLFAGNAIVIKPSEVTPGVGELLKEIFDPLPSGVVSVVQGGGDVGAALVDAPCDKISFIGSPATGRKICEAAAKHLTPVVMELGGVDAAVVCDDVDVEFATSGVAWGAFFNCGQTCSSLERIYVADSIADEFSNLLVEKVNQLRQGEDVGSLTFKPQLGIVQRQVDDAVEKGARVLTGGPEAGKSNEKGSLWFAPTVIDGVNDEMSVQTEESFGPVVTITRVTDEEEAIRRANEEGTNLTASVWSSSASRAESIARRLRSGSVSVNGHGAVAVCSWAPWGGVGESGFGRLNGEIGIREFCIPVHFARPIVPGLKLPFWFPYDESSDRVMRGSLKMLAAPELGERLEGFGEIVKSFAAAIKNKL